MYLSTFALTGLMGTVWHADGEEGIRPLRQAADHTMHSICDHQHLWWLDVYSFVFCLQHSQNLP